MKTNQKGFTLIELLVVIAIIAILAAILFPVFARAREKARQTTCTSNQRQIAASVQMYAQDHEETLPAITSVWQDIKVDPGVLICPTAGKKVANGYGYASLRSMQALGDITDPTTAVLTADSGSTNNCITSGADVDLRHSGKAVVSYVDGHVTAGRAVIPSVWDYQAAVKAIANLTHLWSFDGANDTARLADSKGSANLSQTTYGSGQTISLGVAGFDATSTAVDTKVSGTNGAGLVSGSFAMGNTVSMELLFKPATLAAAGFVVDHFATGERGYFFYRDASNNLQTCLGSNSGDYKTLGALVSDHWYFATLTATYSGGQSTMNAWIADLTAGQKTLTKTVTDYVFAGSYSTTESLPLYIGLFFNGPSAGTANRIDELAVYSTALTEADFKSHLSTLVP